MPELCRAKTLKELSVCFVYYYSILHRECNVAFTEFSVGLRCHRYDVFVCLDLYVLCVGMADEIIIVLPDGSIFFCNTFASIQPIWNKRQTVTMHR